MNNLGKTVEKTRVDHVVNQESRQPIGERTSKLRVESVTRISRMAKTVVLRGNIPEMKK